MTTRDLCAPIVCDAPAASPVVAAKALRAFMARDAAYREQFLQRNYEHGFDGYSYSGQADSTHQAADDLLHTLVLSDMHAVGRYPAEFSAFLAAAWPGLRDAVRGLEAGLLEAVDPALPALHRRATVQMLSANFYPPGHQFKRAAAGGTRLSEHPDVSLLTVFPFGTDSHLQYRDGDGNWRPFPDTNTMVAFPGYLLEWLTGGAVPALNHRVALDADASRERLSFALFSIPRPGVTLHPLTGGEPQVAEAYFRQYLSLWDY